MVRYMDLSKFEIVTKLLGIVRVVGTPNAVIIFEAVQTFIENELKLPSTKAYMCYNRWCICNAGCKKQCISLCPQCME